MTEPKTQKSAVLLHLQTEGKISSWEAIQQYGATRLSGIIYTLRKEGHQIVSEDTLTKNRFGNSVKYATYKFLKPETL